VFAATSKTGTLAYIPDAPSSSINVSVDLSGRLTPLPDSGLQAVPGAMKEPVGTGDAVALAYVGASGYDGDRSYVLTISQHVSQNFHSYRTKRITAGDSTVVTVAPDDAICLNNVQDFHPWPTEYVCRTVRIVVPRDGVMTMEVLASDGQAPPGLEVEFVGGAGPCCSARLGNPTSIPVTAGTEVMANVEMARGSSASQSYTLNTSMARQ
jgi:hypothetical protein